MQAPDFVVHALPPFDQKDLLFLFENFPIPGVDAVEAVRRVHEQPNTLESILESGFVRDAILARDGRWLEISPRLFFNILLRHSLRERRDALDRQVIHYLANLLAQFAHGDRLYRVQSNESERYEYLTDLLQDAVEASPERQFLIDVHIGNFSLYLSGVCEPWVHYRQTYRRRPVSLDYYKAMGANHYAQAASSFHANLFGLQQILERLAVRFEYFRTGMRTLAGEFFPSAARA